MNDEKLNALLDQAMEVKQTPALWAGISKEIQPERGLRLPDLIAAAAVAATVLLALRALPSKPPHPVEWIPVLPNETTQSVGVGAGIR